jgi:DNA-binding NarL/FixJ family response regulator
MDRHIDLSVLSHRGTSHGGNAQVRTQLGRIRSVAQMLQQIPLSGDRTRHMAGEIERLAGTAMAQLERGGNATAAVESGNWNLERLARLSGREREILIALAAGETVQQIAHRLSRSPKTINNHRTHVLSKLGLRNSAQLARFAIAAGLIDA